MYMVFNEDASVHMKVDTSVHMNASTGAAESVGLLFQRNTAQLSPQLLRKAYHVRYGEINFEEIVDGEKYKRNSYNK